MPNGAEKKELIKSITSNLPTITVSQLKWINKLIDQFNTYHEFRRNPNSDIISESVLNDFGDALRDHHCFSRQAFSKDRFEYALETVLNQNGITAKKSPSGNPGDDITIRNQKFSLKSQADKSIKKDFIHISKFHELGKGAWSDKDDDLIGLREQFFNHMRSYDRILTLRQIAKPPENYWHYELVEIPKSLLLEAKTGELKMMHSSTQKPKPGYCYVYKEGLDIFKSKQNEKLKFALYFDGGGERKLQIKSLDKSLCMIHAEWVFAHPAEIKTVEDSCSLIS